MYVCGSKRLMEVGCKMVWARGEDEWGKKKLVKLGCKTKVFVDRGKIRQWKI